jgi:2,4-dienoyl-CoA reductase-like NADH-dependent reductase (Old Yellow Enzyme family)
MVPPIGWSLPSSGRSAGTVHECDPEPLMSELFAPLQLRSVVLRNRIGVAPMCQYRATDGVANDWHLVHLASRAVGGNGLVCTEATAVAPEGRISPACLGLWNDEQAIALEPIVAQVRANGAVAAIQLAHAGRKASTAPPWEGGGPVPAAEGGWDVVGPSPLPFDEGSPVPHELASDDLIAIAAAFRSAAARARDMGCQLIEVHAAHGYLLHSFHSPLTNRRTDRYGGDLVGRTRLTREVVTAIREVWPEELPLAVRLSVTDWVPGGWSDDDSVQLSRWLVADGVDLIDCSSGGAVPGARIPVAPGYQVPFAARIRREAAIASAAVGLLTTPRQAERIIAEGQADLVLQARESLRDPYWPRRAAVALGALDQLDVPPSYARGWR